MIIRKYEKEISYVSTGLGTSKDTRVIQRKSMVWFLFIPVYYKRSQQKIKN